jgi:type IV secretion system protein VirD4
MNLWLNPRIGAATDASDFDLRDLRRRRMSLYLCVSPDNLARVAPLYSLLLQELVDLNTRDLPAPGHNDIPVLVLLDEFARLGHATVIAQGFSYVAGYGLRLLPVLQSPAQLRAEYGADLAEEIMANCGVEIAFAPKELKVAQDLSERLGTWTYAGRSKSRPALLSSGHWSTTESDQRRPLMLPQELIQMPANRLIILKAGIPPVRGTKIVYWREGAFKRRLMTAPSVPPRPASASAQPVLPPSLAPPSPDPLALHLDMAALPEGLPPLRDGATETEVEAWVEHFIDASAQPREVSHAR